MKGFLGTFVMCLVCCYVLMFFFGAFLFSNIWVAVAVFALLLAIAIHLYGEQSEEIDRLKERLDALEGKEAPENGE